MYQSNNHNKWYKDKIISLLKEILFGIFSISFIIACFSHFVYFIHEHVTWRRDLKKRGKYIRIHSRASIRNAQNIIMGNNVRITMDCCIWAEKNSKIIFGNNILIGPGVKIFTGNHGIQLSNIPIFLQDRVESDIIIEDNVWIGANSVITSGVIIKTGAVIAAGSIVTKNVETNTIVGGVPARQIKVRI